MKYAINGATTMPYSLEDDIVHAAGAGFEGIEIWWDKLKAYLESHSIPILKDLFLKNNLQAAAICPFLVSPFRNTEELRNEFLRALEIAPQLGCKLIVVCPDFQPVTLSVEKAMERHCREFEWYGVRAAENGIMLAIEPIGGHTLVPGPAEALKLIECMGNRDNMGIVMDTFHYMKSNISMDTIEKIPVERLFIVHVNDSEDGMINELQDKNRVYPTLGKIDLKSNIEALRRIGYKGYLSVEIFREEYWKDSAEKINSSAYEGLMKMLQL